MKTTQPKTKPLDDRENGYNNWRAEVWENAAWARTQAADDRENGYNNWRAEVWENAAWARTQAAGPLSSPQDAAAYADAILQIWTARFPLVAEFRDKTGPTKKAAADAE